MPYSPTTWQDRVVQYPARYSKTGETASEVTLTASPGTVTQAGTPINATNMNKIESGISAALPRDGSAAMTGQIVTVAGTLSAPAIAPTGDSNTGIFFPSADTIAFTEGGAEVMRITSTGSVGIGTANPDSYFHVRQTEAAVGLSLLAKFERFTWGDTQALNISVDNSLNSVKYDVNGTSAGDHVFLSGNQEKMRITSAGNVGIGTQSPTKPLEVLGDFITRYSQTVNNISLARIFGGAYTGNPLTLIYAVGDQISNDIYIGGGTSAGEPANNIRFYIGPVGTKATGAEVLRITPAGVLQIAGTGTQTTPIITNSSDSNTGIYFAAADKLAFTEGGKGITLDELKMMNSMGGML